ncbi:MAG: DMT family transporter, partial [Bacteroidota bacterium]
MEQDRNRHYTAHIALGMVAIFYGINYFTIKEVFIEGYSPFAALSVRCMVATLFFVIFHAVAIREKIKERKDFLRLALCALFGVSINQTFFLWGISETSRVNSAVLMITTPIFVFLVAWLLKQETITRRKLLGLALSFGGAMGLTLTGVSAGSDGPQASIFGDVLIMLNAASYGIYLVLVRPLVLRYNTFTIIKWLFIFGSIPNILVGLGPLMETDVGGMSGKAVFGVVYLILFATIGAYFLNAWAMKKLPSSAVGIYIYVQPIFVTLFSAYLSLGEVDLVKFQFILLIFAGVYLVTTTGLRRR